MPTIRSMRQRLASALRRRMAYAWTRCTGGSHGAPAEPALDWLTNRQDADGLPALAGQPAGCPGVTGGALETVIDFGAREVARRWARWLMSIQRPDGSLPDAARTAPSLFDAAQAVCGWCAASAEMREVEAAALSAGRWLCASLPAAEAALTAEGGPGTFEKVADLLSALAALSLAARRFGGPEWEAAAEHALHRGTRKVPTNREDSRAVVAATPTHLLARQIEALIELSQEQAARELLDVVQMHQRRDGSVPVQPGAG